MRVLFKKGKQKQLIENFKKENALTWKELCNNLDAKEGKLRTYIYETCLIPDLIYKKLDKDNKYNKFIIEKRKENWGRIKGGNLSNGKTKKINLPKDSKELAEFYGIMLGDGNLTKIKGYKIGTYMIRIVGDLKKDEEYLLKYVKPLIKKLFGIEVRNGNFKQTNAMFIESHGIKLVEFLETKGFKPGNKIKNKLGLPDWIKRNPSFLKRCLRGLYDTDGSAYKLGNQNSYQINFCNYNKRLLKEVRKALISLSIFPSKITKGTEINITKKSELRRFLNIVGFSNSKHLNKVKMWKIAP